MHVIPSEAMHVIPSEAMHVIPSEAMHVIPSEARNLYGSLRACLKIQMRANRLVINRIEAI